MRYVRAVRSLSQEWITSQLFHHCCLNTTGCASILLIHHILETRVYWLSHLVFSFIFCGHIILERKRKKQTHKLMCVFGLGGRVPAGLGSYCSSKGPNALAGRVER